MRVNSFGRALLVTGSEPLLAARAIDERRQGALAEQPEAEVNRIAGADLAETMLSEVTGGSLFATHIVAIIDDVGSTPPEVADALVALAREPELLILDEPTNGLDPAGIEEIRSLIIHLAQQGITIMVSSHLLDEIDKMASVLGIINNGTLIFQGSREELSGQSIPDFVIESDQAGLLQNFPGARMLSPTTVSLSNLSKEDGAHLLGELHAVGARVFEAYRASQSLEDIFMKLTAQGQLQ